MLNSESNEAVSVVVDRVVLPEKIEVFEEYLRGIIAAAEKFSGYLGADVINSLGSNRYIVVFRFLSEKELNIWSKSNQRNYWVDKIDGVIQKPPEVVQITGMETWFYLPQEESFKPPPKFKMAIVTYLTITPTILFFETYLSHYFAKFMPKPFTILITAPFIVLLMTYVLMPLMTKLFHKFLFN